MFNQQGFDISFYQGAVDFNKMKSYGAKFLILRAGQGNWVDTKFVEYITAARGILPISVYHFYDPIYSPQVQAEKLLTVIEPYRSIIRRVWLDLEFNWSGGYALPQHWKTYKDLIKSAGWKVGWYTGKYWWDARVGTFYSEFSSDPLWVAQYSSALTLIPKGWIKAAIWQNGTPSIGYDAGVSSAEIDHDLWNDEFNFSTEWGIAPTGETMYAKVTAGTLNIRSGGSPSYPDIGDFLSNDYLIASENIGGWLHVTDARRGGWGGLPVRLSDGRTVAERAASTNDVWCNASYTVAADPPSDAVTIDITLRDVKTQGDAYEAQGVKLTKTR